MNDSNKLSVSLNIIKRPEFACALSDNFDTDSLLELLKLSVESSSEQVFWIKSSGEVVYVNNSACIKLGYQREQLFAMRVWEWDTLLRPETWKSFWLEIENKEGLSLESVHQTKAGETFPVRIKTHLVSIKHEKILFAYVSDISEEKLREKQVAERVSQAALIAEENASELRLEREKVATYEQKLDGIHQRYDQAIEDIGVGLWSWDVKLNTNYWSPKYYELLGYDNNEVEASFAAWEMRLHPDDKERVFSRLQAHLEQNQPYDVEFRLINKQSEYRWFHVKGKAEFNAENQPVHMVGTLEDIHDQKLLEEAYKFEKEKFEKFVNLAPVGVIINDLEDGSFIYVNDEFSRYTGYEVEDLNNMDYIQLTPAEYAEQDRQQVAIIYQTGRVGPFKKEYIHKKGHRIVVSLTAIKMPGPNDKTYAWTVVQDITDRQRAEKELLLAKKKAEVANKAKTQFLATMSHEIRTPMNGIFGTLQLLERQAEKEDNDLINNALMSSKTLLAIINDILDYSKIEAKMLKLEQVPFVANDIINSVITELTFTANKKSIQINSRCQLEGEDNWLGDPTRFRQIITNLISNAIKFSENGQVHINLKSRLKKASKVVVVEVRDDGIGMSQETISTLFDRFTQADTSTTREYGGTGLGMAITKNLIDLMNGSIFVKSELGQGTVFTVELPLSKASQKAESVSPDEIGNVPDFSSRKLLIVEDNEINQTIIESMLHPTNAKMEIAENGIQAIKKYDKFKPDIILMDIQMPLMDGLEACQKIRETDRKIPIIALTANVMLEDVKDYLANGFNAHVGKPISIDQLLQTIDKLFND